MHKLATFEFIEFQGGFLDGKEDLYFKITENLDDELELDVTEDDYWYVVGYNCALAYYNISYNKYKTPLCFYDEDMLEEVIVLGFIETLIKYNQQTKEHVPMVKYIIRR